MLQEQILKELERIPEEKLAELYDLIHYFRLGLEQEKLQNNNPTMSLAGVWADMPDDVFESLLDDVRLRRRAAFSGRPARFTR